MTTMTRNAVPVRASDLQIRIWREFREMPGLRITLGQACRLFGLDPAEGADVLQGLIDAGVIRQIGPFYMRADLDAFVA